MCLAQLVMNVLGDTNVKVGSIMSVFMNWKLLNIVFSHQRPAEGDIVLLFTGLFLTKFSWKLNTCHTDWLSHLSKGCWQWTMWKEVCQSLAIYLLLQYSIGKKSSFCTLSSSHILSVMHFDLRLRTWLSFIDLLFHHTFAFVSQLGTLCPNFRRYARRCRNAFNFIFLEEMAHCAFIVCTPL